jgi:hypothetical protein
MDSAYDMDAEEEVGESSKQTCEVGRGSRSIPCRRNYIECSDTCGRHTGIPVSTHHSDSRSRRPRANVDEGDLGRITRSFGVGLN